MDVTFGASGHRVHQFVSGQQARIHALAQQSDGKIVAAGFTGPDNGNCDFAVARYDANGNLDTSFGTAGVAVAAFPAGWTDVASSVAIQADGKIVVAGSTWVAGGYGTSFGVVRFNSNGNLDTGFGTNGFVARQLVAGQWTGAASALAIQPGDQTLVTAGWQNNTDFQTDFAVARWTTSGAPDNTFGGSGSVVQNVSEQSWGDVATSMLIQADGKIILGGYAAHAVAQPKDFALVRFTSTGGLDTAFGTGGMVMTDVTAGHDDYITGMALQSDGKIVAVGYTRAGQGHSMVVARYTAAGVLDSGFGTAGLTLIDVEGAYPNTYGQAVALQGDGKIVAVGYIGYNLDYRLAAVRLNTNGAPDSTFGAGGKVSLYAANTATIGTSVLIQSNGRIIAGGYAGDSGSTQAVLLRLMP